MDFEHGILFFFIGMGVTVVGFFIAYLVAIKNYKKELEDKKPKEGPLTFL
tara:strand:+ start:1547 stop:1696 length:150 start_codon:yes stop_codon:yes gene_type:complete